jgi:hypothetical protein
MVALVEGNVMVVLAVPVIPTPLMEVELDKAAGRSAATIETYAGVADDPVLLPQYL